jgi:hypothetical protein
MNIFLRCKSGQLTEKWLPSIAKLLHGSTKPPANFHDVTSDSSNIFHTKSAEVPVCNLYRNLLNINNFIHSASLKVSVTILLHLKFHNIPYKETEGAGYIKTTTGDVRFIKAGD